MNHKLACPGKGNKCPCGKRGHLESACKLYASPRKSMHEKYIVGQAQANAAQQEKKNEKKGAAFVTIEDEDWFKEVTFMTTNNVEPILGLMTTARVVS